MVRRQVGLVGFLVFLGLLGMMALVCGWRMRREMVIVFFFGFGAGDLLRLEHGRLLMFLTALVGMT